MMPLIRAYNENLNSLTVTILNQMSYIKINPDNDDLARLKDNVKMTIFSLISSKLVPICRLLYLYTK
jgi:hypothetical protein